MIRSLALIIGLLSALPASAQMLWNSLDEVVQIEVREGWRAENGRHFAALEITLFDGWKTYWRSPGATGIAPRFSWGASQNLSGVAVHWPTPSTFMTAGYPSLGYAESLVLPIEFAAVDAAAPIVLRGKVEIGVCLDICLPAKVTVTAVLSPTGTLDPLIVAALDDTPQQGRGQVTCAIQPTDNGIVLQAAVPQAAPLGNVETVAVELRDAHDKIWIADTESSRQGQTLQTRTEFMPADDKPLTLDRSGLRFTVVGARGAVEYFGCVSR